MKEDKEEAGLIVEVDAVKQSRSIFLLLSKKVFSFLF